jgi:hypothetical protein
MNSNHFKSLALLLVFGAGAARAQEASSYEMSPEEIEQELVEMDAEAASSVNDLLEDLGNDVEDDANLPTMIVDVFKSPRGFGIDKEFVMVWVNDSLEEVFATSTGRSGNTPAGSYHPYRMHKIYNSRTYNNSIMDWAVFFKGGFAVHSTTGDHYYELGRRASKGCVRLARPNARKLFYMMQEVGCSHRLAQAGKCRNITIRINRPGTQLHPTMIRTVENRLDDDFEQIADLIRDRRRGKPTDRCSETDPDFARYCRR